MENKMDMEVLKASLATIQGEIYKVEDPNSEELENLRRALQFNVMFIEQKQCQMKVA